MSIFSLSVLDLDPIAEGSDAGVALNNARDLAQANEMMATTQIFDHGARVRSYELLAEAFD